MNLIVASLVGLLVLAILVALLARRLSLPYTVGLVATGIALAPVTSQFAPFLSHDLIYLVILPPLLFEAAIAIPWPELRRDLVPVLVFSIAGVVVSALVTAGGMAYLLGWPLPAAVLFGVLIAATDPVAVIALFKDLKLKGRLKLLVESESLFNDGVAAVLFVLVLAWARAPETPPDALSAGWLLVKMSGGGVLVGLIAGAVTLLLAGRTVDHLVSAALTTAAAYGSFVAAEHFGFSGVLATVAAGLLIGNRAALRGGDRPALSSHEREFVLGYWEFAAFLANSLIFLLIGVTVAQVPLLGPGLKSLLVAVAVVLLGRLLTIYPLSLLFARSRWAIARSDQHILFWGGLRGALALALALSLPASLPYAYEIRLAAFAVVAFSILIQGMTIPLLLRRRT
jgi:CPA1 family monovalent cation:H+ antiporter